MKRLSSIVLLVCVMWVPCYAQLCTGSLGDPLMNIHFGEGSNPGPQLPAGQTSYPYKAGSCPGPGEYSLVNLTFSCFENSWHTLSGDHTPDDAGGYYMLVNAQSTAGTFFTKEFNALCPNTTYQFSTWFKNALRPTACGGNAALPNLVFTVETLTGSVLATYKTGAIPKEADPQWQEFGVTFKTTSTITDVVLKITDAAVSGCGNAFALDDITMRACGPQVLATIAPAGVTTFSVCDGDNRSFALAAKVGNGFTNPVYQWQVSVGTPTWQNIAGANSAVYTQASRPRGDYSYRVLVAEAGNAALPQCRIASNSVFINVLNAPFVQATNYVYGCLRGQVTLQGSGANNYVWTGPNGFSSTEQSFVLLDLKYSDAGKYKVTGTTNLGCTNSDSTILQVYPNATASSSDGLTICEGTSTRLVAAGGKFYDWVPSATLSSGNIADPIASPAENTRFSVKVTNEYGCSDTAYINVNVWKNPVANAGPDLKTRIGIPVTLRGSAMGTDVSWYWTPQNDLSNPNLLNPVSNAAKSTSYQLHVVSPYGCSPATDTMRVQVFDKILIPNAFSPNGDGINDTWFIDPLSLFEDAITEVYNRNGQVVYRTKGYNTPWNGTSNGNPLPTGTYYYVIDLRVNKEPKLTGSITIIR